MTQAGYESDGAPSSDDDKTYDKVAKILAKAERAGTPEEAEAFFGKAQELITKHMLDEMVLKARVNGGDGKDEQIESEDICFSTSFLKADQHTWSCVARANNCRVLLRGREWPQEKRGVVLIGRKSDREHVKMLTASLLLQVGRLSLQVPEYLTAPKDKRNWRRSFRFGFADEVGRRLASSHQEAARSHAKGDMLPVLASVDQRVEQYMEENFNVGKARGVKINGAGMEAGRRAGQRADVGNSRVSGARGALGKGGR